MSWLRNGSRLASAGECGGREVNREIFILVMITNWTPHCLLQSHSTPTDFMIRGWIKQIFIRLERFEVYKSVSWSRGQAEAKLRMLDIFAIS